MTYEGIVMKTTGHPKEQTPSGDKESEPFLPERELVAWADRHGKSSRVPFPTRGDLIPRWQREDFFRKKRNILVASSVLLFIGLTFPVMVYLLISDTFKGPPALEIRPDNCYDRTIRVVADADYKPFSYREKNGEAVGLDVELIYEVCNRLRVNVDLELTDWNTARNKLLNREADLLLNMELQNIERDERVVATIPTAEKQYVVYGKKCKPQLGDRREREIYIIVYRHAG